MLATDLRYELVRTHVGEVQRIGATELGDLFAAMEAEGRARLGRSFPGAIDVRRAVDMRYGEQIFEIQVPLDGVVLDAPDAMDRIVARFHRRHEEIYTYSAPDQDVVLVNARLAIVGVLPSLPAEPVRARGGTPAPRKSRRVHLGEWMTVPVHDLDALGPGAELKGPVLFESATTTVLVRAGERVEVTPHGWLDIRLG
jgi:N-methylhydantoinase A